VYKKADIPEELHIKNNIRVGDMILIAKKGYMLLRRGANFTMTGVHGYMTNESSMHPFFIGFGPRFKQNFSIETFHILDIYPLMCSILNVRPAIHNGSLANVLPMLVTVNDEGKEHLPGKLAFFSSDC
jgi:ectonucleotide pyrophosphatase/phosphodiesterase family protein 7